MCACVLQPHDVPEEYLRWGPSDSHKSHKAQAALSSSSSSTASSSLPSGPGAETGLKTKEGNAKKKGKDGDVKVKQDKKDEVLQFKMEEDKVSVCFVCLFRE